MGPGLRVQQWPRIRARQQLMSQLQENKFVGTEIQTLEPDAQIYKLVGPVLIPQETAVAKDNVAKRPRRRR